MPGVNRPRKEDYPSKRPDERITPKEVFRDLIRGGLLINDDKMILEGIKQAHNAARLFNEFKAE